MKKFRNSIFYIGIIGVFSILMYWIILLGVKLETGRNITIPKSEKSHWSEFMSSLLDNLQHPLALLLAQIVTIIFAARIFGWKTARSNRRNDCRDCNGAFPDRDVFPGVFHNFIPFGILRKSSILESNWINSLHVYCRDGN